MKITHETEAEHLPLYEFPCKGVASRDRLVRQLETANASTSYVVQGTSVFLTGDQLYKLAVDTELARRWHDGFNWQRPEPSGPGIA